jgi:hypothetical protein
MPSFEICRRMYSTVASQDLHLDAFKKILLSWKRLNSISRRSRY